jgi:multiple sugar transport system substrate-binding protein
MTLRTIFASAVALTLFGATDALADEWSEKYPIKEDIPGPCSFAEVSKWDYSGRELTILTHAVPVMGEPVELHAKQFAELTGAKINVIHAPWGELFSKVMIPFQTGQHAYDIVYGGSHWIGDWAEYLAPVPQKYKDMPQMQAVTATYIGTATWNGEMVQFPMDGDRHYFKYVVTPFENPEYQQKFKEKHGRDLTVPRTWEEYAEVGEFFNGWDWDGDGEPEYGSTEILKRDDLMFNGFVTRVAPYAKKSECQRRILVRP